MTDKPKKRQRRPCASKHPIDDTEELVEALCATIHGTDGTTFPCFCRTISRTLSPKEQEIADRLLGVVAGHRDYIVNGPNEEEIAKLKEFGKKFEEVFKTLMEEQALIRLCEKASKVPGKVN